MHSFVAVITVLFSHIRVYSEASCLFPVYSEDVGGLLVRETTLFALPQQPLNG